MAAANRKMDDVFKTSGAVNAPMRSRKDDWSGGRLPLFPTVPHDMQQQLEAAVKDLTLDDLPGRRKPHPLYTTSNGEYGKKKEAEGFHHNDPHVFGRKGQFTREFFSMKPSSGLCHTRNKNPVLPDPSFGDTPYYLPTL